MLFCFLLKGSQEPAYFLNPNRNFISPDVRFNFQIQDYYQSGLNDIRTSVKGSNRLFNPLCQLNLLMGDEYRNLTYSIGSFVNAKSFNSLTLIGMSAKRIGLEVYHRQRFKGFVFSLNYKNYDIELIQLGFGQSYHKQIYYGLNFQKQEWKSQVEILSEFHIKLDSKSSLGLFMGVNTPELRFYYQRLFKQLNFSFNVYYHDRLGLSPVLDIIR